MVRVRPAQAALRVACGAEHTVVVIAGGASLRGEGGSGHQLFTAGSSEHGRLGRRGVGAPPTTSRRSDDSLWSLRPAVQLHAMVGSCTIIDVSAGAAHTLVAWKRLSA